MSAKARIGAAARIGATAGMTGRAGSTGAIVLTWATREPPLLPCAVVATGQVACALADRLLAMDAARRSRLSAVAGDELLAVRGAAEDLSWADGVVYLGRDPEAPNLLLPTSLVPRVPVPLVERALLKAIAAPLPSTLPLAILPEPLTLIPMGKAAAIDPGALEACREAWRNAVAGRLVGRLVGRGAP